MKITKKEKLEQIANDLDEIVCVIDKIGSGFDDSENMALALVLFFKERHILDKLSTTRRLVFTELSKVISKSDYNNWIERETTFWRPPYQDSKTQLLEKIEKESKIMPEF